MEAEFIACGSYGTVEKLPNGCVKKLCDYIDDDGDVIDSVIRETCFLSMFNHPSILSVKKVIFTGYTVDIRMEYGGISLHDWVYITDDDKRINALPYIIYQLAHVLAYLERYEVLHSDVKPANILINKETLEIKLIDYGAACMSIKTRTQCLCTYCYAAPEILLHGCHNIKSDIFSLGMVIRFIINKAYDEDIDELKRIMGDLDTSFFKLDCKTINSEFLEKCQTLLELSPENRPSAANILKWGELSAFKTKEDGIVPELYLIPNYWTYKNISMGHRGILVDWLYDVFTEDKDSNIDTFVLAINIFDRYMSSNGGSIDLNQLQLVGAACYIVSTCIINNCGYSVNYMYCLCKNVYTCSDISGTVWTILSGLNYRVYSRPFTYTMILPIDLDAIKQILIDPVNINKTNNEKIKVYNQYLLL